MQEEQHQTEEQSQMVQMIPGSGNRGLSEIFRGLRDRVNIDPTGVLVKIRDLLDDDQDENIDDEKPVDIADLEMQTDAELVEKYISKVKREYRKYKGRMHGTLNEYHLNKEISLRGNFAEAIVVAGMYFEEATCVPKVDYALTEMIGRRIPHTGEKAVLSPMELALLEDTLDKLLNTFERVAENDLDNYSYNQVSNFSELSPEIAKKCFPLLKRFFEAPRLDLNNKITKIWEANDYEITCKLGTQVVDNSNTVTDLFLMDRVADVVCDKACRFNEEPASEDQEREFRNFFSVLERKISSADKYGYGDSVRVVMTSWAKHNRLVGQVLNDFPLLKSEGTVEKKPKSDIDLNENRLISSKFGFLNQVLAEMPEDSQLEVLSWMDTANEKQREIIKTILEGRDNKTNYLISPGDTKEDLAGRISNEAVIKLIEAMANDPKKYRVQLGALLSVVPVGKINPHVLAGLKPMLSELEMKIRPDNKGWYLCETSERRLIDSLLKRMTVIVNDNLMVKFTGKLTALCMNTFVTPDGYTFVEGNWYSPVDDQTRNILKDANDSGKARVTMEGGEWVVMRQLKKTYDKDPEEVLEHVRLVAKNMDELLPLKVCGLQRKQVRHILHEEQ